MWLPAEGLPNIIKDIKNPVGVELGTAEGYSTQYLLSTISDLTLHGIDPYRSFLDVSGVYVDYDNNGQYDRFIEMTSQFGDRYIHHLKTSDDAIADFADNSLDFIFVDGSHEYEQVLKDLRNYYSKVKIGGIFSGHDWSLEGVQKAVKEFCVEIKQPTIERTTQDVWYWKRS